MSLKQTTPVDKYNNHIIQEYNSILKDMAAESWFVFMNHGYAPCNIELKAKDQNWKHQISLYNNLIIQAINQGLSVNMSEMSFLEIGCGRGGGLSFIKDYYNPKQATGIDLNVNQINFCKNTHIKDGLDYIVGDGCSLDFNNNNFDVIVNVESSHLYSNINKFFIEVSRTLKDSGLFLYTDVFTPDESLYQQLLNLDNQTLPSMEILYAEDMTQNVIQACELDKKTFKSLYPAQKHKFIAEISASKEELYRNNKLKYLAVVARKVH